jgi:5-methylcytosine-specific restriction endonuclease McrA
MGGDVTVGRVGWWKAWRAAARNRAAGTHCFYCSAAFAAEGPLRRTVDHRVPRSAGGHDGLANLVFACHACNQRKAASTEADFLASEWLAARRRGASPP